MISQSLGSHNLTATPVSVFWNASLALSHHCFFNLHGVFWRRTCAIFFSKDINNYKTQQNQIICNLPFFWDLNAAEAIKAFSVVVRSWGQIVFIILQCFPHFLIFLCLIHFCWFCPISIHSIWVSVFAHEEKFAKHKGQTAPCYNVINLFNDNWFKGLIQVVFWWNKRYMFGGKVSRDAKKETLVYTT